MPVNLADRPPRLTFHTPWSSVNDLLGWPGPQKVTVLVSETPDLALAVAEQWSSWLVQRGTPTLFLAYDRGRPLNETEEIISRHVVRDGTRAVFINPPPVEEDEDAPRYQQETEMYKDLTFVAQRTNVMLVVLNQVTCLNERGIVRLEDLPETEAYEYEADQILFMRPLAEESEIEFTVVKNRYGPMHVAARCGWINAQRRVVEFPVV